MRKDFNGMSYSFDIGARETVRYEIPHLMTSADIGVDELAGGESLWKFKNGKVYELAFDEQYRILQFVSDCREEFGVEPHTPDGETLRRRLRDLKFLLGYEQFLVNLEV